MNSAKKRSLVLASAAAMLLTASLVVEEAAARRPRPQPCRPGRYAIEKGPLVLGDTGVIVENVSVESDLVVSLSPSCGGVPRRYAGVRKGRSGRKSAVTVLRARLSECATIAELVHVRARIDGLCDTMKGVIRVGGSTQRFTARRAGGGIENCVDPESPVDATTPVEVQHAVFRVNAAWLDGGTGSTFSTAFFETARRYMVGEQPRSRLERDAYKRFAAMSPEGQQLLACAARNYATFRKLGDTRLLSPDIVASGENPLTEESLALAVAGELSRIADVRLGWAPGCAAGERSGLPREQRIADPDGVNPPIIFYPPTICEVRGVRTADFQPPLTRPELEEVVEKDCTITPNLGVDCKPLVVSPGGCPGSEIYRSATESYCYEVPWVHRGETVTMRGLNFRDTDLRVKLRNKAFPETERIVDAYVCGDTETPATEMVGGFDQAIFDCRRVNEHLTFVVPNDLPAGIYEVRVIVPDSNPLDGRESSPAYIRVLLPPDATYQLTADHLECVDPTNWEWGSDEIGLRFVAIPVGLDSKPGPATVADFRDGNVDEGDVIPVARQIISAPAGNLGGIAVAIVGHERDDDNAYQKGIDNFADAYTEFMASSWNAIAEDVGELSEGIASAAGAGDWSKVIGFSMEKAVHVWVAFWMPADLILADHLGLGQVDITERVSVSHPAPPPAEYRGPQGIKVIVEPGEKDLGRYEESRRYSGNSASSTYRLFLRHNRS